MSVVSAFILGLLFGAALISLGAAVGIGAYHKALANHIKGYKNY